MPTNKATGTKINNGGSAFPMIQPALDPRASGFFAGDGMTLRDWFAGQALIGIIGNNNAKPKNCDGEFVARNAYRFADAMIKERMKEASGDE